MSTLINDSRVGGSNIEDFLIGLTWYIKNYRSPVLINQRMVLTESVLFAVLLGNEVKVTRYNT